MSYKLEKPFTEKEKSDFIVEYNHNKSLLIEETEFALFALEKDEIMQDGEPIKNPNYEEEQKQKEQERIAMLHLTAADVERGIYKAKGMDFKDIINFILTYPQDGLDLKALRIELKANHFYRGNVYVNVIGNILGFTSEQLDKFFEDGNYEHLLTESEVIDD